MDMMFLKNAIFFAIGKLPFTIGKAIVVFALLYYFSDFILTTKKNRNGEIELEENSVMQFK